MTEILQQFPQYAWAVLSLGLVAIIFRLIAVLASLAQSLARQPVPALPAAPPVPTPPQPPAKPAVVPPPPPVAPTAPAPSGPFASAPPWFQWALHEIGVREEGNNSGAALARYRELGHCGADHDPWCAIFANAALESSGISGTRSASSQSFRKHPGFVKLAGPALGCIVVFGRGSPKTDDPDIGHVGFYRGSSPGRVWTLGGNEDDMVELAPLIENGSSFWLIGYYWPASVPRPAIGAINIPMGSPVRTPIGGAPAAPVAGGEWITGITATMFGGADNPSAYDEHMITDAEIGCALPFHYPRPLPLIEVRNPKTGATLQMNEVDVGPWNVKDDWLRAGTRPLAEAQYASGTKAQNGRVPTNDAGIDLTPAAATRLGIEGKGKVDVRLITTTGQSPTVT